MQTYWDIPKKDRHALTAEQVEKFVAIERAEQGCYVPDEPVAPPEPDPLDLARIPVYRLRVKEPDRHSWRETSMHFRTREAAEAAGRAAVRIGTHGGLEVIEPHRIEIEEQSVVTAASYAEHAAELERQAEARESYEIAHRSWSKALEAAQKAGAGIWADWQRRQEDAAQLEQIRKAHARHLELAEGSEAIARRFTVKAFGAQAAAEALGLEPEALKDLDLPKPKAEPCDTDLPF